MKDRMREEKTQSGDPFGDDFAMDAQDILATCICENGLGRALFCKRY